MFSNCKHARRMPLLTVFFLFSILTACFTPVKEEQRDSGSLYRGYWGATFLKTPSEATSGGRRLKCTNMEGDGYIDIAGGRVVARVNGYDLAGYIDAQGKFTSAVDVNKDWRYILQGELDADSGVGEGKLIYTQEKSGLSGCSSKVKLKKSEL